MSKKIISIFVLACLVLGLLPIAALADTPKTAKIGILSRIEMSATEGGAVISLPAATEAATYYAVFTAKAHVYGAAAEGGKHYCECGKPASCIDADNDGDHLCDLGCGDMKSEHKGGSATCSKLAVCIECKQGYGDLKSHTYDNDQDTDCNVCGDIREVEAPHEHSYGEWEVTVAPGRETEGKAVKSCACGDKIEKTLPANLRPYDRTLELKSNLSLIYRLDAEWLASKGYSNPTVTYICNGDTYVAECKVSGQFYEYNYAKIGPHMMKDNIKTIITAEYNGEVYTIEYDYSVYQYCTTQLKNYYSNANERTLCVLLVDILNYGAATQNYRGYKTDDLANANLESKYVALGTSTNREYVNLKMGNYATVTAPTVAWKQAALVLLDSVTVQYAFVVSDSTPLEELTIRVEAAGKTWNISAAEAKWDSKNAYYLFDFSKLVPSQMGEGILITMYKGGTAVSNTIRYSIESYAHSDSVAKDPVLKTLVEEMLQYGDSVKEYEKTH